MDDPDVRKLLAAIMAYDNRRPGEANVAAWVEASRRGRWTFPEALEAVHAYFAERSEWLMPGSITQAIRAARQDAAMRRQDPPPDPIGVERLKELTVDAFKAIGSGDATGDDVEQRRGALARACPFCGAAAGQRCTRTGQAGRVPLTRVHPSRLEVAA